MSKTKNTTGVNGFVTISVTPYVIIFVICYFLLIYMHYGATFVVDIYFSLLLCLRTSMIFCIVLHDSGSHLVILRTDL